MRKSTLSPFSRKNSISLDVPLAKGSDFVGGVLKKFWALAPEASWVFLGQVGTSIAGLVGIKLLTWVLDPSEFGRLALANTILALVGTNFFGPFGQGFIRYWSISKDRGSLDVFYSTANRFHKYLSLLTFLCIIMSFFVLTKIKNFEWAILVSLALAIGAVSGLFNLRVSIFTAARQRKRTAILNISSTFLRPLVAASLIILTIADASIALVGYLFAATFLFFVTERFYSNTVSETSHYLKSDARPPLFRGIGKEILSYSSPFFVWSLFSWVHLSCDRWSLQIFYGSEVVGAFSIVSQLAIFPLVFGSGFLSTLFSPIAFQRAGNFANRQNMISASKLLVAMTGFYILGTVILVFLFSTFHHRLVLLISNSLYAKFSSLLPWLTVAWSLFYLGQVIMTFGLLANHPHLYILPKLVSSVVAAVSTFYLAAKIGALGVVWGLIAAGFIFAAWCAIIAARLLKNSFANIAGREGRPLDVSTI